MGMAHRLPGTITETLGLMGMELGLPGQTTLYLILTQLCPRGTQGIAHGLPGTITETGSVWEWHMSCQDKQLCILSRLSCVSGTTIETLCLYGNGTWATKRDNSASRGGYSLGCNETCFRLSSELGLIPVSSSEGVMLPKNLMLKQSRSGPLLAAGLGVKLVRQTEHHCSEPAASTACFVLGVLLFVFTRSETKLV